MRFLDHTALNRLSVLLRQLDVGDRIVSGRLELFTTAAKLPGERRLSESIEKELVVSSSLNNNNSNGDNKSNNKSNNNNNINSSPSSSPHWRGGGGGERASSPLGEKNGVQLLINLISTMNQCFPDYDFSSLAPERFRLMKSLQEVVDVINYTLSFTVERVLPGFLSDLWAAIADAVCLEEAEVWEFVGGAEAELLDEGRGGGHQLSSLHLFFHDKKAKRILFFSSSTKSKLAPPFAPSALEEVDGGLGRGGDGLDDNDEDAGDALLNYCGGATAATTTMRLTGQNGDDDDNDDDDDDVEGSGDGDTEGGGGCASFFTAFSLPSSAFSFSAI